MTNKSNSVFYTGVTSDLYKRVKEHKEHHYPLSFTSKYNCTKLVYFENYPTILEAISEEKRIKAGNRKNKIRLIESINPEWQDLFDSI